MKKFILIILASVLLSLNFSCQSPSNKKGDDVADGMELIVEPGEHWQGKMKVLFFYVKKTPQMAAWVEDDNGHYIATITVTNRSAQKKWRSAPKEGRPESLPVWNHRQQNSQALNDIDTVSTATPKASIEARIDKGLFVEGNTYHVYLEINHSFDYNDYWTKDNSGVNGQPSLIYYTQFIAGQPANIFLVPMGHGSVDGSNGDITSGLESFTTALSIVHNASIVIK
ncbi:MAG: DUF2271 domain-containing protein [Treponema sp.]|nr:DUF2271 domain-containing protein [Treponema sp.]